MLVKHKPFRMWNDIQGYAGFVPSHNYFTGFYNMLIEKHARELDQHMAMLPAHILCIDHSHKVPKHLGKVNGIPVFGALHTVVNEFGEVRAMTLTPTKAHDQFMPALSEIANSLKKYGHGKIELVNNFFNIITDDLAHLAEDATLSFPFDMEWSIDRSQGIQGHVALIQLIYASHIYLLPVKDTCSHLPHALLAFLRSPHLFKVGVHPFVGALELGRLAKDRNLVDQANISLADLTAKILECNLPKDDTIRVSTAWDNPVLTPEQEMYAALDVFAIHSIYDTFTHLSIGGPITNATVGGTIVKLLSHDQCSTVAYGIIAPDRPTKFAGVNVSKTRTVVNVTRVLASGYLMWAKLSSSHHEVLLSSLGTTCPFQILCCTRDLRICTGKDITEAQLAENSYTSTGDPITLENPTDHMLTYSEGLADNGEDYDPKLETIVDEAKWNSRDEGISLEETFSLILGDERVRSQVLGDTWHLMDMFKISVHHGLRRAF
ncbi:uncharacterized protein EV420DRAFT_1645916 [Desarmillaria tabescens]|uniref:3'-5' exonuclease domain-containing protein n=1 Tax=Armillaria tabescens TaxID=1929756 RepID=A0AA39MYW2_ARMTA|nr:uncharacterized protein EV420DRAFT_1645916 [Desarmillaria tabescens]KAK0451981.1 hypothetical protein EV420DRAFT_1645916 [Desarmillaria tabescens]